MRILTIILILLLFATGTTSAQSTDSIMKYIDTRSKTIQDNLDSYDTTMTRISSQSTEGGELIGYYKKGNLRLMTVFYYGETGNRKTDYYFDKGQLCFVEDTYYSYNRPIYWDGKGAKNNNDTVTFDSNKIVINEHDRYYFANGKLINWTLRGGRWGDKKLAAYTSREILIPKKADELKRKLK